MRNYGDLDVDTREMPWVRIQVTDRSNATIKWVPQFTIAANATATMAFGSRTLYYSGANHYPIYITALDTSRVQYGPKHVQLYANHAGTNQSDHYVYWGDQKLWDNYPPGTDNATVQDATEAILGLGDNRTLSITPTQWYLSYREPLSTDTSEDYRPVTSWAVFDDFEDGTLTDFWTVTGTAAGLLSGTGAHGQYGAYLNRTAGGDLTLSKNYGSSGPNAKDYPLVTMDFKANYTDPAGAITVEIELEDASASRWMRYTFTNASWGESHDTDECNLTFPYDVTRNRWYTNFSLNYVDDFQAYTGTPLYSPIVKQISVIHEGANTGDLLVLDDIGLKASELALTPAEIASIDPLTAGGMVTLAQHFYPQPIVDNRRNFALGTPRWGYPAYGIPFGYDLSEDTFPTGMTVDQWAVSFLSVKLPGLYALTLNETIGMYTGDASAVSVYVNGQYVTRDDNQDSQLQTSALVYLRAGVNTLAVQLQFHKQAPQTYYTVLSVDLQYQGRWLPAPTYSYHTYTTNRLFALIPTVLHPEYAFLDHDYNTTLSDRNALATMKVATPHMSTYIVNDERLHLEMRRQINQGYTKELDHYPLLPDGYTNVIALTEIPKVNGSSGAWQINSVLLKKYLQAFGNLNYLGPGVGLQASPGQPLTVFTPDGAQATWLDFEEATLGVAPYLIDETQDGDSTVELVTDAQTANTFLRWTVTTNTSSGSDPIRLPIQTGAKSYGYLSMRLNVTLQNEDILTLGMEAYDGIAVSSNLFNLSSVPEAFREDLAPRVADEEDRLLGHNTATIAAPAGQASGWATYVTRIPPDASYSTWNNESWLFFTFKHPDTGAGAIIELDEIAMIEEPGWQALLDVPGEEDVLIGVNTFALREFRAYDALEQPHLNAPYTTLTDDNSLQISGGQEVLQEFTTMAERLDMTGVGLALQAADSTTATNFSITIALRETVDSAPQWMTTCTVTDTSLLSATHPVWLKVGILDPTTGEGIPLQSGNTVEVRISVPEKPPGTGTYAPLRWAFMNTLERADLGRTIRITHNVQESIGGKAYAGTPPPESSEDGFFKDMGLLLYTVPDSLRDKLSNLGRTLMSHLTHPMGNDGPRIQIPHRPIQNLYDAVHSGPPTAVSPTMVTPSSEDGEGWMIYASLDEQIVSKGRENIADQSITDLITMMETTGRQGQLGTHKAQAVHSGISIAGIDGTVPLVEFVNATMFSYDVIYWSPLVEQAKAGRKVGYDADGSDWLRLVEPKAYEIGEWVCLEHYTWNPEEQRCVYDGNPEMEQLWKEGEWNPQTYQAWKKPVIRCPDNMVDASLWRNKDNYPGYSDEAPCLSVTTDGHESWSRKKVLGDDVDGDANGDGIPDGKADGELNKWDKETKVDQKWEMEDVRLKIAEAIERCPDNTLEVEPLSYEARFGSEDGFNLWDMGWTSEKPCMPIRNYGRTYYGELTSWQAIGEYPKTVWKTAGAHNYHLAYASPDNPTRFGKIEMLHETAIETNPTDNSGIPVTFWTFDPEQGLYSGHYRNDVDPLTSEFLYTKLLDIDPIKYIPIRYPTYYEDLSDDEWFGDDDEIDQLKIDKGFGGQYSEKWARYPVVGLMNFTLQVAQSPVNARLVIIKVYDSELQYSLENARINAQAGSFMGAGADPLAETLRVPTEQLTSISYWVEHGTEGVIPLTVALPRTIADMEPPTADGIWADPSAMASQITSPLVKVAIYEIIPGHVLGQDHPQEFLIAEHTLYDLFPSATTEKSMNPYNYYAIALQQEYTKFKQEVDHSVGGYIKRHFNLLAGVGLIIGGALTGTIPNIALGIVMLHMYMIEYETGQSLFAQLGALTGGGLAWAHNRIGRRLGWEDWNAEMNLLSMTGNTAIDQIIGAVFTTAVMLAMTVAVASGLRYAAGRMMWGRLAQIQEISLWQAVSKMGPKVVTPTGVLDPGYTPVALSTGVGVFLYKLGDERNNLALQQWGRWASENMAYIVWGLSWLSKLYRPDPEQIRSDPSLLWEYSDPYLQEYHSWPSQYYAHNFPLEYYSLPIEYVYYFPGEPSLPSPTPPEFPSSSKR